jgi:protein-S-isoprenylcysteine O-methyltransferase Ste14
MKRGDAAMTGDPRRGGLARLVRAALRPPPGAARIALALALGLMTHLTFAGAGLAMVSAMFFGLSESFGRVPQPWTWAANLLLIAQFPLAHSLLLTKAGGRFLARLVPGEHGAGLASTTYAFIASLQLITLFAFWTPSGIIWWRAEGPVFALTCAAYGASWLMLMKASFDAGLEVQSGALGWLSLMGRIPVRFPDMPVLGLFRIIRQPIYAAFALTLWTVPVWTPDQLCLAVHFTLYCVLAPRLKERRFKLRYGGRFEAYRRRVPYFVPRFRSKPPPR